MSLTPRDWHRRFLQQAGWTRALRQHLLARLELTPASRILEAGCGTGVITAALVADTRAMAADSPPPGDGTPSIGPAKPVSRDGTPSRVYGLDFNAAYLRLARQAAPGVRYTEANALRMPYTGGTFDAVVCHFFLLWVPEAARAIAEMLRVTRPGGAVIAFAEPDYGGRIDHPPALAELGQLQAEALRQQGADPAMGRKLYGLFHAAGLRSIETGVLGAQWPGRLSQEEIDIEWSTLEADLAGKIPVGRIQDLRQRSDAAWESGERVLFVPTFYAIGYKR
jgi:ubiquinone/menaquinone biosynthesis C-methylase UbiE